MKVWLKRNKIYFETIGAIVLTLSAIFISWLQYDASMLQFKVAKATVSPQIHIHFTNEKDDDGFFGTSYLDIVNDGGLIENPRSSVITFLSTNSLRKGSRNEKVNLIPFTGFYNNELRYHTPKDLISRRFGYENNRVYHNLLAAPEIGSENYEHFNINLLTYVKFEYDDILGEHYIKYFKVDPISNGSLISESEYNDLNLIYNQCIIDHFCINLSQKLNINSVINLIDRSKT